MFIIYNKHSEQYLAGYRHTDGRAYEAEADTLEGVITSIMMQIGA